MINIWRRLELTILATGFETNNKFNKKEKRFWKIRNNNNKLHNLFNTINHGFYAGNSTTGIFIDVKKGFDQVWIDGLLFKLMTIDVNRKLIR